MAARMVARADAISPHFDAAVVDEANCLHSSVSIRDTILQVIYDIVRQFCTATAAICRTHSQRGNLFLFS